MILNSIKKIIIPLAILVISGFVLFFINQIAGVYLLVRSNSIIMANILLVGLIALALFLLGWPFVLYLKLPRPMALPQHDTELPAYRKRLIKRLKANKILKQQDLVPADESALDTSLDHLNEEANKVIKQTANAVFLTTAVSQNGKLDALTILATQSRMIWKIAHIYYQRPTLRELIYLYANVSASSLLAAEIEDLDVSQQVEPVVRSFFKNSAGKSIPVIGSTANIILDSLLEGSTNAFFTLRVGVTARRYCGCNEVTQKKSIKKNAFRESSMLLKEIVAKSSSKIIIGLFNATKNAGVETLKSGWEGLKNAGGKMATGIGDVGKRINPFREKKDPSFPPSYKI